MKRVIGVCWLTLALALALPTISHAQEGIIECGGHGDRGDGTSGWTYGTVYGAGIFNLTTRRVGCRQARRVVFRWGRSGGTEGFRCQILEEGFEYYDVRCTASGGRVIRWQTGA